MKKILAITVLLISLIGGLMGQQTVTLTANPPSPISNVSVFQTGTTGGTFYCYWVVAVYNSGMGPASTPACTYASNGTLSGSNFNTISWSQNPPGGTPIGYWVVRGTTFTFPGTGTNAVNSTIIAAGTFTQTDQTNTLNAFVYAPVNGAIVNMYLDNLSFGVPAIMWSDGLGNTDVKWYQVAISPLGATAATQYAVSGLLNIAAVNSGTVVLPAINGVSYRLVGFELRALGGAVATCTSININDTTGTPVVGVAVPAATLTQNTIVSPGSANITFTTYAWQGAFASGKGMQIMSVGSSCATATQLAYKISYQIN